ncbi:IF factor, partial [Baryphthengus martii]|nr:IF factor [Baryphthengus martii]
ARSRSRGRSRHLPPPPQALETTEKFYTPREWDCDQAFTVVLQHDYRQPMAIAQVLPALVDKPYLKAGSLPCASDTGITLGLHSSPSPNLGTTGPATTIKVNYSITNQLQGKHFHFSTSVSVPAGSTLLKVLQVAQEKEPETFSFQTEQTSWGPMVTSIHGLAANTDDKTYWKFLSSGDALQEGVGTYKPHDGEHIEAVFSTY